MEEKETGKSEALSPLADPVVGAIFCDVEHSGEAIASIVGAAFAKDGLALGRVLSVTPQRYHKTPGERGVRIDVEATTGANEVPFVEVQLYPDISMLQRNLFAAANIFVDRVPEGVRPEELVEVMPWVIAIDILNYNLRDDNRDYFQPIKLLYTKAPRREALSQFSIYALQLPRVREMKSDFNDNLYCWLYLWDTANREKRTVEEVIAMTPELKAFAKRDAGFAQYCERYHQVAANPEVRAEYYRWVNEQMRQNGMIQSARLEGRTEGKLEVARKFLAMGLTAQQVAEGTGLPLADVEILR